MKKLLIVVDFQNDFVDGALGFPGASDLGERIAAKITEYRDRGDVVAFTFDTHQEDYLATQEGRNLPVAHCVAGTPGHDLHPSIADLQRPSDPVFRKPTFGSSELFTWLHEANDVAERIGSYPFTSIELVGLVSNICVISNAVIAKAACPEVPIIVDASCTASHDQKLNEAALDVMEGLQIKVTNR